MKYFSEIQVSNWTWKISNFIIGSNELRTLWKLQSLGTFYQFGFNRLIGRDDKHIWLRTGNFSSIVLCCNCCTLPILYRSMWTTFIRWSVLLSDESYSLQELFKGLLVVDARSGNWLSVQSAQKLRPQLAISVLQILFLAQCLDSSEERGSRRRGILVSSLKFVLAVVMDCATAFKLDIELFLKSEKQNIHDFPLTYDEKMRSILSKQNKCEALDDFQMYYTILIPAINV